ncbi:hypothetical protein ACFLT7_04315 [candidate division KSB1 bacterium]
MKPFQYIIRAALLLLFAFGSVGIAQETEKTSGGVGGNVFIPAGGSVQLYDGHVPQTRLQLRDMGIAPFDLIPAGQTAITALAVAPDGKIYGGTTGEVANLFVFSPGHNLLFPLGTIPGQESIFHSLVVGDDNSVYFGTTKNVEKVYYPDEKLVQGRDWYYKSVTMQIKADFAAYPGGHLYRYDPASTRITFLQENFRINKPCPVTDLGIPVPNEGIYTLMKAKNSNAIYGISYPGAKFFRFDPATKKTNIIATLNSLIPTGEHLPLISRALVQDNDGNIYANTDHGYLLRYSPAAGRLDTLNVRLPGLAGRELFNAVQSAVAHPSGEIYGGTNDGYVFCYTPSNGVMRNLGKPLMETRIRALTVGQDGNVYGVGGHKDGVCRLFVYDVREYAFTDLGMVEVAMVPYYEWKGFMFDSMVTGLDGSVYLGNSEHRSRLFIYNP